jgi:hypothetical protein
LKSHTAAKKNSDEYPDITLFNKKSEPKIPIRFCVITALAEVADRIVAEEILKTPEPTLEAVLPLVPQDYINDFTAKPSKDKFEQLLKYDSSPKILRQKPLTTLFHGFDKNQIKEKRRNAYLEVGEYIVDHCDMLIAVWDGQEAKGKGGTGDIVAYARKRGCPLIIIPPNFSRSQNSNLIVEKGLLHEKNVIDGEKHKDEIEGLSYNEFCRFEIYNTSKIDAVERKEKVAKNTQEFLESLPSGLIEQDIRDRIQNRILPLYSNASIHLQKSQEEYFRAGKLAYTLSPLAVMIVVLGIHFPQPIKDLAFLTEFVILLFILCLISRANRRKVHKKWIETCRLTEHLRASVFFRDVYNKACRSKAGLELRMKE